MSKSPRFPQHTPISGGREKMTHKIFTSVPSQSSLSASVHSEALENPVIPQRQRQLPRGQTQGWLLMQTPTIHLLVKCSFLLIADSCIHLLAESPGSPSGVLWDLPGIWSSAHKCLMATAILEALVHTLSKQRPGTLLGCLCRRGYLCWLTWSPGLSSIDLSPKHSSF